ncbi:MAG TPA: DUF5693 family protein, partial [Limnochordia bacterium]|nr:DUF5693 family protein [Limnochordia bacterium]
PAWLSVLVAATLWGVTAALDVKGYTLAARAVTAWVAAVSGPVTALAWVIRTPWAAQRRWWVPPIRGLGVAAILAAAIVFEVTALADDRFLNGLAAFHGVKALLLVPPVWVALLAVGPARRPTVWLGRVRVALAVGVRTPVTWGALALVAAAGAAVYVYLWRSGNSGATFPLEAWVRQHLQDLLGVRPRTKEWLLGVPALVLALTGFGGAWRPALWAAAAVGCASVSDTFAHAHAPLAVSLLRSAYGWGIGGALGLCAAALLQWRRR